MTADWAQATIPVYGRRSTPDDLPARVLGARNIDPLPCGFLPALCERKYAILYAGEASARGLLR